MIAEINEVSVFGEMLRVMGQTGHHPVDCSRVWTWCRYFNGNPECPHLGH